MLFNQTGDFDLNHSYTGGCYKDKCLMLLLPAVIEAYRDFEVRNQRNSAESSKFNKII